MQSAGESSVSSHHQAARFAARLSWSYSKSRVRGSSFSEPSILERNGNMQVNIVKCIIWTLFSDSILIYTTETFQEFLCHCEVNIYNFLSHNMEN